MLFIIIAHYYISQWPLAKTGEVFGIWRSSDYSHLCLDFFNVFFPYLFQTFCTSWYSANFSAQKSGPEYGRYGLFEHLLFLLLLVLVLSLALLLLLVLEELEFRLRIF